MIGRKQGALHRKGRKMLSKGVASEENFLFRLLKCTHLSLHPIMSICYSTISREWFLWNPAQLAYPWRHAELLSGQFQTLSSSLHKYLKSNLHPLLPRPAVLESRHLQLHTTEIRIYSQESICIEKNWWRISKNPGPVTMKPSHFFLPLLLCFILGFIASFSSIFFHISTPLISRGWEVGMEE